MRDELRGVLGHFATGVTVIAAEGPQGPAGLALNSFASVALEPPRVSFCPSRTSESWPVLRAADAFAINVLGADQADVAQRFSLPDRGARFANVPYHVTGDGAVVLDDAIAHLTCTVACEHEAGDHTIVVADVKAHAARPDLSPLLFFRGRLIPSELA